MMGPETRNDVSAGSTDGGTLEAGEVDAAALEPEAAGSVPPHPPARRAAAKANNAIRLRILFLHKITSPANTTLSNRSTNTAVGKLHTPMDTIQCELCRGLPFLFEWRRRRWRLRLGHKK